MATTQLIDAFRPHAVAHLSELALAIDETRDPAEIEWAVVEFLVSYEQAYEDGSFHAALLDEIERLPGAVAIPMLKCACLFARASFATLAAERLRGLANGTSPEPAPGDDGTPRIVDAARHRGDEADLVHAILERPGRSRVQLAIFAIGRREPPVLHEGHISPPVTRRKARRVVADLRREFNAEQPAVSLTAQELVDALRAPLEQTAELRLGGSGDLLCALPIVARAAGETPDAFPKLTLARGELGDLHPRDEDEFDRVAGLLVDEFCACGDSIPEIAASGEYVIDVLLNWKWRYGDARLGSWTAAEVRSFMLDHAPRSIWSEDSILEDLPMCVACFFEFLDELGKLDGDGPGDLAASVERAMPEFVRRAQDPAHWGPSKALVPQMRAEGVEPTDNETLQAWMADFNSRPFEERDRILGPSIERSRPSSKRHASRSRRQRRRSVRAARRRNRR